MGEFEAIGVALWAAVGIIAGVTVFVLFAMWLDERFGVALVDLLGLLFIVSAMLWALIAPAIRWWRGWH